MLICVFMLSTFLIATLLHMKQLLIGLFDCISGIFHAGRRQPVAFIRPAVITRRGNREAWCHRERLLGTYRICRCNPFHPGGVILYRKKVAGDQPPSRSRAGSPEACPFCGGAKLKRILTMSNARPAMLLPMKSPP